MDKEMKEAILNCHTLSKGEKKILTILNDFEYPLPSTHIQDLMNNTKQALHYSLTKLQKKELITREKDSVFLYKLNKEKLKPIVDMYRKTKQYSVILTILKK